MTTTSLALYRSVLKDQFPDGTVIEGVAAPGVLYPDFYARPLDNGSTRDPDVEMVEDDQGAEWVKAGGGTSLFDVARVFKGKKWLQFDLPSGTEIPDSLVVRRTHYSTKFKATHYQIEAKAKLMRKDTFQGALDNLARNAITRSIELSKSVTKV